MEIDIASWPELIFRFGPYAILALFVLWVAPRASKRMSDLTKTAPKAVRVSATVTLVASWSVVLIMVAYVLFKWSPVRVYDGSLGVLKQSEQIYPLDENVYVKMEGTQAPGRERWHFVLVDNERNLKKEGKIHFTYYWGRGENEYTDYAIPVAEILDGRNTDFHMTRKTPEAEYTWQEGSWKQASYDVEDRTLAFDWGWNAYADDKLQKIAEQLASPNRLNRASARQKMRELSTQELEQLKNMSSDPTALHQIELEQQRRNR